MFAPALLFFSVPKEADAFWGGFIIDFFAPGIAGSTAAGAGANVTTVALSYKQLAKEIGKEILRNIAKRALQAMTKSTLNWINSGFHGAPLFLENPQSFFKDIAKYEVKTFVDEIGYNTVGMPFGKDFALGTIYLYKQQFQENARYSLSEAIKDPVFLESYRNDFNVGGWNGFLVNTQYPQNNFVGFQLLATEELARRLDGTNQTVAQKTQSALQQGLGFLSPAPAQDWLRARRALARSVGRGRYHRSGRRRQTAPGV